MTPLYFIFVNDIWVKCDYDSYHKHNGKKYKSPHNVLEDLNSGKIVVEDPEKKKKSYYASGMALVNGQWQSCGWNIQATSFLEAAKIAASDPTFRVHSLSDNTVY